MMENAAAKLDFRPTGQGTGAHVRGLNLREPVPEDVIVMLKAELATQGVLVVRGQADLTEAEQIAFTASLGQTQGHPLPGIGGANPLDNASDLVFYLTNAIDGSEAKSPSDQRHEKHHQAGDKREKNPSINPGGGELAWHSDLQYMPEPQVYSVLYGIEIPASGGETEWCNMTLAYAALDEESKREIEGLRSVNWLSRKLEPACHPVVRIHPATGARALYVSPGLSRYIEGWDEAEGRALIGRLAEHATQPAFCYRHQWQPGDVTMWDNRVTMHRRHGFDLAERRIVRRTQTVGEAVIAA
ncbi:MAG: TauD/TfdA family dioxygenase [Rhodospirillaceae bacterium]|jgi:alpha-ketoglutarate-dependent taurine dioxygenase|nr:TauD/TfdA family dioxygenase [Rhodospirillaceae bacterium]MBT5881467.1 TauD/TfdA family dioxygenase [Rhodospirillaceae bacterium]MBT6591286.1 TauD/TfdA family dioxygenase [Rhodospirillaceae bacterium]MBT6910714.1 TauD/TfdA family dioxygenase [Rhodospirillaceae bacterium]MBT6986134.1 TauD/TfdA family dioxygenase [Rhodospirillaceae bacterium]